MNCAVRLIFGIEEKKIGKWGKGFLMVGAGTCAIRSLVKECRTQNISKRFEPVEKLK